MGSNPEEATVFKNKNNPQHACLQKESKLQTPCHKTGACRKSPGKYEQKYFTWPNPSLPSPVPPALYKMALQVGFPESSSGRIRSFPHLIIPPWFSTLIYELGDELGPLPATVQRHSLTPSTS
jgi:hypothetical protein